MDRFIEVTAEKENPYKKILKSSMDRFIGYRQKEKRESKEVFKIQYG